MRLPRVALVGAGGVGGVVAASLALARRCQLTVVARGAALNTLQRAGLEVELDEGRRVIATPDSLTAVDPADTATVGPQDYVVVSTKAHQLADALPAIEPMLGPDTTLVTLMNGLPYWWRTAAGKRVEAVDPGGRLSSVLPSPGRVIGSVGFVAGTRVFDPAANQHLWLNKWPTDKSSLLLGSALGGGGGGAADRFAALFDPGSELPLPVNVTDDIGTAVWEKLMINASINTLATVARVDCGELVDDPSLRAALGRITAEVAAVASSEGLAVSATADSILSIYRVRRRLQQDFTFGTLFPCSYRASRGVPRPA